MKNSIKYFKSSFYKHLALYVLGIIIVPTIILTATYYKTRVKETEKFSLFFTTDKIQSQNLHNELQEVFKDFHLLEDYQYRSSIVKQTETAYLSDLETYGVSLSDFMVIPSRYATEDFFANYTFGFKDYYEDGISFGTETKVTYAIRVMDHVKQTSYLEEFINYELTDEDYYICISKNSFHYNNYINNTDSVLLSFINWMFLQ